MVVETNCIMMAELKADLHLLVECLRYQLDNPKAVVQALHTIASICTSHDAASDSLREEGGLTFIVKLLMSTEHVEVREAAMFALGCAVGSGCVYSQKELSTGSMFSLLRSVLTTPRAHTSITCTRSACFLISSLVTNNRQGQILVRNSSCLDCLLDLFKTSLPEEVATDRKDPSDESWFENLDGQSMELWASVTGTICSCLNNPQNDENQRLCAGVFPRAMQLLQDHHSPTVVRPIASLISLATANNVRNQERILKAGGVDVLVDVLYRCVNRLQQDDHRQLAVCIVKTLDTILTDNASIAELCGRLGMVSILLQLLGSASLDHAAHLQVILALGHLADVSVANQVLVVEAGGMITLIQRLTDTEVDGEMSKAIRYVLHICVNSGPQVLSSQPTPQRQKLQQVLKAPQRSLGSSFRSQGVGSPGLTNFIKTKVADLEHYLDDGRGESNILTTVLAESASQRRPTAGVIQSSRDDQTQKPVPKQPGHTRRNILAERLKRELTKERQLRQELQVEAEDLRHAIKAKNQAEQEQRSAALTQELVRQEKEQSNINVCRKIKITKQNHDQLRLNRSKADMVKRIHGLEQQLKDLHRDVTDAEESDSDGGEEEHAAHAAGSETKMSQDAGKRSDVTIRSESQTEMSSQVGNSHDTENLQQDKTDKSSQEKPAQTREDKSRTDVGSTFTTPKKMLATVSLQTSTSPTRNTPCSTKETQHSSLSYKESVSVGVQTPRELSPSQSYFQRHIVPNKPSSRELEVRDTSEPCTGLSPQPTKQDVATETSALSLFQEPQLKSSVNCKGFLSQPGPEQENACYKYCNISEPEQLIKSTYQQTASLSCISTPRSKVKDRVVRVKGVYTMQTPTASPATKRILMSSVFKSPRVVRRRPNQQPAPPPSPCPSEFDAGLLEHASKRGNFGTPVAYRLNVLSPKVCLRQDPMQYSRTPSRSTPGSASRSLCGLAGYNHRGCSSRKLHRLLTDSRPEPFPCHRALDCGGQGDGPDADSDTSFGGSHGSSTSSSGASPGASSQTDSMMRQRLGNTRCPACQPAKSLHKPLLNSRTYNIAIETSSYTCALHRRVRIQERCLITTVNSQRPKSRPLLELARTRLDRTHTPQDDLYHFSSSASDSEPSGRAITPPRELSGLADTDSNSKSRVVERRPRVPYTEQEITNLKDGVVNMGKFWNQILLTYCFHPSRTAVDLKDKYRQLMRKSKAMSASSSLKSLRRKRNPFSLVEERRLRRGVRLYGYNWKAILSAFNFAKCRKPQDLKDKWQHMHSSGI